MDNLHTAGESFVLLGMELQITLCDQGIGRGEHHPALPGSSFPFSQLTEVLCSSSSGILPPCTG